MDVTQLSTGHTHVETRDPQFREEFRDQKVRSASRAGTQRVYSLKADALIRGGRGVMGEGGHLFLGELTYRHSRRTCTYFFFGTTFHAVIIQANRMASGWCVFVPWYACLAARQASHTALTPHSFLCSDPLGSRATAAHGWAGRCNRNAAAAAGCSRMPSSPRLLGLRAQRFQYALGAQRVRWSPPLSRAPPCRDPLRTPLRVRRALRARPGA